jgi:hypothetical protein
MTDGRIADIDRSEQQKNHGHRMMAPYSLLSLSFFLFPMKPTYGLPALLSFFIPGLGQLIKGQILKAFLIWAVGGALSFFLVWTIVVPFVIWAWNVYDAYNDPA